ncbi:unnamed protein product [Sphenostylis stenocarpa]|uniref:Uncharacterized protein n=1 Tax=Sphenostylis stenocarpa TaxID=92480 RepID=A0AA87B7F5_9FABA|nr:unnamed protein product [Sphenostylis stenocarpa]
MANKYFALLLVACLVAAASVDALQTPQECVKSCLDRRCGPNPKTFCSFLCDYGCSLSSGGIVKNDKMETQVMPTLAPQPPRKVQAQGKETIETNQEFH